MRYLNYKVILYNVHMWNYLIFLRNLDVEEKREEGKRVREKERKRKSEREKEKKKGKEKEKKIKRERKISFFL
jgi:hypothetical protein